MLVGGSTGRGFSQFSQLRKYGKLKNSKHKKPIFYFGYLLVEPILQNVATSFVLGLDDAIFPNAMAIKKDFPMLYS